ncbi:hypothetical protein O1L55_21695 [Streptomyces albulus]|nr:hypothetical protein [Streptomyces noursei]
MFVSRPAEDGRVHVSVDDGNAQSWQLAPGEHRQVTQDGYEVRVRVAAGGEPPGVEIGIATVPKPADRRVLALDAVYDGITVGSWVAVERPRKGADGPDGIPGDKKLAFVTTRVTAVRTAVHTQYGITGRGTVLTLADPWLDEHDVTLDAIRDTTVHAAGQDLVQADDPVGEDVHGDRLELAALYDGLRPGRYLIVSGERTDIPGVEGVRGTELAVIAGVEQTLDPALPGDRVHTTLTLTRALTHRYRRDAVRVQGNVVLASHGESRDEAIGSGDAARANQTFALWQSPLTWLPSDNPWGRGAVGGPGGRAALAPGGQPGRPRPRRAGLRHRFERRRQRRRPHDGDLRRRGARRPAADRSRQRAGPLPLRDRPGRQRRGGPDHPGRHPPARRHRRHQPAAGHRRRRRGRPGTDPAHRPAGGLRPGPAGVPGRLRGLRALPGGHRPGRGPRGVRRAAAGAARDGRRRRRHPLAADAEVLRALRASLAEYGDGRLPVRVDVREPCCCCARRR